MTGAGGGFGGAEGAGAGGVTRTVGTGGGDMCVGAASSSGWVMEPLGRMTVGVGMPERCAAAGIGFGGAGLGGIGFGGAGFAAAADENPAAGIFSLAGASSAISTCITGGDIGGIVGRGGGVVGFCDDREAGAAEAAGEENTGEGALTATPGICDESAGMATDRGEATASADLILA